MWHSIEKKEVFQLLKSSENGISEHDAALRLKRYGENEIREIFRLNPFFIFLQQFKSVFIFILLFAAAFSLVIQHYIDFAVILAIVMINSFIGFFQHYKAEKTISAMKEMLVPKVRVLRNNKLSEILSSELVPGDVLFVSEGDKVMADCRLLHVNELETNEAVLTGESFPQKKTSEKLAIGVELADRENMVYMGTTIVKGNARTIVVSTGMNTEFGRIASLVQKLKIEKTPLEKKFDLFSKNVALVVVFAALITSMLGILRGEEIFDMILTGISLAVSVIPEGLPAVMAITLAFAIGRMHKHNALIRKLPAAETLGRTTVICTDKTGTLTVEQMTVTELYCNNMNFRIENNHFLSNGKRITPSRVKELMALLKIGILCNNARIERDHGVKILGDPTEKALVISADKAGLLKKEETEREPRVIEYSFSSKRKLMSIVRKTDRGLISYVKGAPDILLKKCTRELVNGRVINLTDNRKKEIHASYEEMASGALRVLGFAYKKLPSKFDQNSAENGLVFVGFQGMMDPPRKEVKSAIRDCINAGIKVKMITGDSLLTAVAVSNMIGLDGESIEEHELEKLSEEEFNDAVRDKTVFAHITPELKLRIIKQLKHQKEIVAVTGDGVNDILALKEAHIGIAMGIRGTDVARDVSDIILLDDDFSSIVKAVREGRRVYDNIKKSIKFHLSANCGELIVVLFAMLLSMPLPLLPLAILWMNLITDSLPSLAFTVEKEDSDIMKRKPKNPEETILHGIWQFIVIAGLISFLVAIGLFALFYQADLAKARTIALSVLVFCELFLAFTCRSDKPLLKIGIFSNKFLIYSVLGAFALQLIAIYTPLSAIFGFKALAIGELLVVIAASSIGLIFFETIKSIRSRN